MERWVNVTLEKKRKKIPAETTTKRKYFVKTNETKQKNQYQLVLGLAVQNNFLNSNFFLGLNFMQVTVNHSDVLDVS